MISFIAGLILGIIPTLGFCMISRWYWKSMYENEADYSNKLIALFEQNHPLKIARKKD